MNNQMHGHNHGGKNHLFGMLGIGAIVLLVLLGTGRSLQQALPLALLLACPLMMVGMMVMMRGGNQNQQGSDTEQRTAANDRDHGAPSERQDAPTSTSARSQETTTLT
ncbi:MAG: DUF2933 domain-containing protein [Dermatophilaceae bacterium]